MLYVLFSPSEGKKEGGSKAPMQLFGGLLTRQEILESYTQILSSNDKEQIQKLFGMKSFSQCSPYIVDIYKAPTRKAVDRYDGVAFDHLEYERLDDRSQTFLDDRLIIFSNLFGPILAKDTIPIYKVKQGNSVGEIAPDRYYKERFSDKLDSLLQDGEVLDLRAGYYEKFYKLTKPHTTLKFLKNGKVISHWAKAYRGIVLKEIAKNKIDSLEAFGKLQIPSLICEEIKKTKNKTQIIYKIVE